MTLPLAPNDATLFERVRILSLTDPRAACAMAAMLAPVAAPAIIARLDTDAREQAWIDDDEYAQVEDTTYDGRI